jgi:hypothetical protein
MDRFGATRDEDDWRRRARTNARDTIREIRRGEARGSMSSNSNYCRSSYVQDYYYEKLDAQERARVARHIGDCEVCAAELNGMRKVSLLIAFALGTRNAQAGASRAARASAPQARSSIHTARRRSV